MSPSSSLTFQWLFDIALRDYEKQTGTKLVDHPLARQLEVCDSVDSISAFLQERAWAFREFRREDDGKVMRSLNRVVYVLCTLSTYSALGEGVGLVRLEHPFKDPVPYITLSAIPSRKSCICWVRHPIHRTAFPSFLRIHYVHFSSSPRPFGRPSKT